MEQENIKKAVRERYGAIAENRSASCCGGYSSDGGCGGSQSLGYEKSDLNSLPEGADLGLGCGNPTAMAGIKAGEVVLDLGSGAGIDCFIAAKQTGPTGRAIGVDMTPEMLEKARSNAKKGGYDNVEFRLGEAEHLPVADNSVDLIISNCVINLVPNKQQAFQEMFRVLKPGGRFMVSDIVLTKSLPEALANDLLGYVGCISGAILLDDYAEQIEQAGFHEIKVNQENGDLVEFWLTDPSSEEILASANMSKAQAREAGDGVLSAKISAVKPLHDSAL